MFLAQIREILFRLMDRGLRKTRDRERLVCKAKTGPCKREVRKEKEPESARELIPVEPVSETISQDGVTSEFQIRARERFVPKYCAGSIRKRSGYEVRNICQA